MSFCKCHAEEIYVRVATGEHFFGIEYIRSGHTDKDLFHELAYGTVVHEKEWLKKHQSKEASNEQTNVQHNRTTLRNEGDMPVRPDRSAQSGARTEPKASKREVRYMCSLVIAGIIFTCLWLLYY